MASQLHYLTVQDILWINLQVTEKVQHFSFAKLEEATYYQYAYGESRNIARQAARFLTGFPRMSPLDCGNEATAFIGCLTFLQINGLSIELQDAQGAEWLQSVLSKKVDAETAINSIAKPSMHHQGSTGVRATIKGLLSEFACTLLALTKA
jgi:prophage maintenance system killer protein